MAPVYRESATESILEASLIPVADVGDKLKRQVCVCVCVCVCRCFPLSCINDR